MYFIYPGVETKGEYVKCKYKLKKSISYLQQIWCYGINKYVFKARNSEGFKG